MNEFIIYSIFPNEDDVYGDAWEYHLELNGKVLDEFGDDYHDKGHDKSKGFIRGYAHVKEWKEKVDYVIKYQNRIVKGIN